MKRRELGRKLLGTMALAATADADTGPDENDWLGSGTLTDVAGIKVGHCTLKTRPTGCTVILCESGAVAGVDVRGSAPGTRETDLLNPINTVPQIQAVVLSGGRAHGLGPARGG